MKYSEKVNVSAYCLDKEMKLSPMHLIGVMLEGAAAHCIEPGITGPDMQNMGYTWVISHFTARFEQFPLWRDTLRIETWASKRKGFKTQREFIIYGEDDQVIALGASIWTILDLENRRPVPTSVIEDQLRSVEYEEHVLPHWKPGRFELLEEGDSYSQEKIVSHYDLDFNQHLNSLKSLEWALNTLPTSFYDNHSLTDLNIHFVGEAFADEVVSIQTVSEPLTATHLLTRKSDGQELCRIKSSWVTKS